jgi:hypothetical protein
MVELTIQLSDELAHRLRPVGDRLAEIIELGLRDLTPSRYTLYNEVVEFFAAGPSPRAIVAFRPSRSAQDRVVELLDKNRAVMLSPEEQDELDQYENLDYLVTLVKARARQRLAKTV